MPQPNNVLIAGTGGVGGVVASPFSEYIGMGLQEYYNYVNNTFFYNTVPAELKPFYRKVQNWERWQNGIVPGFHDLGKGVIPTHLAKSIIDKVSALIYGGGIMLLNSGTEQDNSKDKNLTLDFVCKWAEKVGLKEKLQDVIRFSAGLGTGTLKINSTGDNLWIEAVPFNRGLYSVDSNGKVKRALFYIKPFIKGANKNDSEDYGIFEERYFDIDETGKEVPYVCYKMYRDTGRVNTFNASTAYSPWESLPRWVREMLKTDYPNIRLDKPMRIPLLDLGVYNIRWTPSISSMPHLKFGDSILEGIQKYLCEYDILSSVFDTEMYCGRARVLASKAVTNKNTYGANYNAGLDSFLITQIETMSTDGEPIKFVQPEIRAQQIKSLRNMLLENIATAIGISPSSFASYLQDGNNRTAREISSEESATTLFVENKREVITNAINSMLKAVTNFYGKTDDVIVSFSKAGQTNYTLLVENSTRIYQAGGMSLERYVRTINPQMDEGQVQEEISKIKAEQAEREAQRQNALFGDMDFSDNDTEE